MKGNGNIVFSVQLQIPFLSFTFKVPRIFGSFTIAGGIILYILFAWGIERTGFEFSEVRQRTRSSNCTLIVPSNLAPRNTDDFFI